MIFSGSHACGTIEKPGRVREGAQLVEAGSRPATHELVDDSPADATVSSFAADDHGSHLGDRAAQRRELRARQHVVILNGDHEAMHVDQDFPQLARKQVPFGEVFVNQLVDRIRFMRARGPNRDRRIRDMPRTND